jgi:hypothetical protein
MKRASLSDHTHSYRSLPCTGRPGNQDRAAGDLALLDHLANHTCRPARLELPDLEAKKGVCGCIGRALCFMVL